MDNQLLLEHKPHSPERIPKPMWGPGPWHRERDRYEWRYRGLPCLIVRGPVGALCGYVGVPPEHPLYGVDYSGCVLHLRAADCQWTPWRRHRREMRLSTRELNRRYAGRYQTDERLWDRIWRDPEPHIECHGHSPEAVLDVHGGITFSDGCHGEICHIPADGEPDKIWWLGFDTAHAGDLAPGLEATLQRIGDSWRHNGDVYRDVVYVMAETERLATQVRAFKGRIYCVLCHRRRMPGRLSCKCGNRRQFRVA